MPERVSGVVGAHRKADARLIRQQQRAEAYFSKEPPAVSGTDVMQRSGQVWLPHDRQSQERLRSEDAKYGRFTYYVGEATANQPYYTASGLDPRRIAETHVEVDTTGRMIDKADMDYQVLRRDSHLAGVDDARRVAVAGREVRVEAADPSELALGLRDLGEAIIDDVDSFDGAIFELLRANAMGVSFGEAIYAPKSLRVPALNLRIPGAWPQQIVEVHNRNFRFHPITGIPVLEMAAMRTVEIDDPPYKFLYHWTNGDGPKRQRGHLYKTIWWHLIGTEAIQRWAHCLDFWGIPVPYQLLDETLFQNAEIKSEIVKQLQAAGLGLPFVGLQGDREELSLKFSPTPSGLDARGMHAALLGVAHSEQSKIVQHETLTTEVGGGPGSYKLSETHENTKEALIRMDEKRIRATIRGWLREVFRLNLAAICAAFGASPMDVMGALPRVYWLVDNDLTADARLNMMLLGVKNGMRIDQRQAFRQFGWDAARRSEDAIPGEALTIADGANTRGAVEASAGTDNPKDPTPATGAPSSAPAPKLTKFNSGSYNEADHPRGPGGEWTSGSGGGSASAAPKKASWSPAETTPVPKGENGKPGGGAGAQLPAHTLERLKSLGVNKLPAAHIGDVHVSDALHDDHGAHEGALLRWRDDSGKEQRAYSQTFDRRNAEKKWDRVLTNRPKVDAQMDGLRDEASKSSASAAALLIALTGLRPGGGESLKKTGHYGATTMEARHITFDGDEAHIKYVGKAGKENVATVTDPAMVAALKKNTDGKAPTDRVFNASPDKVAAALPKGVKVKDLRTLVATTDAERLLSGITPKLTGDAKKDARAIIGHLKAVSTAVSKQLNNTPAMARRSYIAPQVIRAWGEQHGIKPEWLA